MAEDIQEVTDQSVNTGDGVQESTEQAKTFTQEEVTGLVAKECSSKQTVT